MTAQKKLFIALALALVTGLVGLGAQTKLLNVSYDPTRELYKAINEKFIADYKAKNKETIEISQSHGGSGKQARSVIDGLEADVVSLALAYDIDAIASIGKLLPENWQTRLPNQSTPYTSTIVFLVKKGNPKGIKDWGDLVKDGVKVITPNPKTSGGARWSFLAAWGYALKTLGTQAKANDFVKQLYANVPVLDTGARASTLTFAQKGIGDVLLSWENEAELVLNEFSRDNYEVVYPSVSILAEPPVAIVDKNVDKHKTRKVAEAYLKYLYTPEAQEIIAKNYYRPIDQAVAKKYASKFVNIKLFTLKDIYGNWTKTQKDFFDDGGIFDKIYKN